ncbi:MAG: ATP-binding protein [Chloroflexi bacterium]|nr:ATP-binding protein [Chloroflexota bacterium]
MDPKEHIENIANDYKANNRVQQALEGALKHVQRSFSRRGQLLMEFIQNAQDAGATELELTLAESALTIWNNGHGFTPPEVDSLCKSGASSKAAGKYIGYLGVGFKSAFLVANRVAVHSGGYDFAFDSSAWSPGAPWQIMPVWAPDSENTNRANTTFVVSHLNTQTLASLRSSFASFQPRTLLWLDNLHSITIRDANKYRRYMKTEAGLNRWRLTIDDGSLSKHEVWLVFTLDSPTPAKVREDQTTIDWDRDQVDTRRVAVAFRMDESDNLIMEPKGTAYISIYSYTPLKDEPIPLHFLVQGDFLTSPNRESIQREAEWNKWLGRELCRTLIENCIPAFLAHNQWKSQFQKILEAKEVGTHPIWDVLIRKPLAHHMQTASIFPAADHSLIPLAKALRVPSTIRPLLSDSDLAVLYPGKHRIADDLDYPLESAPENTLALIHYQSSAALLAQKASERDLEWFQQFYVGLQPALPLTPYHKGKLRNATPFLLTETFGLAGLHQTWIKPDGLDVGAELTSELSGR